MSLLVKEQFLSKIDEIAKTHNKSRSYILNLILNEYFNSTFTIFGLSYETAEKIRMSLERINSLKRLGLKNRLKSLF